MINLKKYNIEELIYIIANEGLDYTFDRYLSSYNIEDQDIQYYVTLYQSARNDLKNKILEKAREAGLDVAEDLI